MRNVKLNKKLMYTAVGNVLFRLYSSKEIAEAVVSVIDEEKPGAVEVNASRSDGFTLRCHKDVSLTESYLMSVLADATQELLDEKYEDVLDYISDTYDLTYDSKYVDSDYAAEIFDISKNGRLISFEADV